MKIKSLIIICFCLLINFSFCQNPKKKTHRKPKKVQVITPATIETSASAETPNQGICGSIVWKSGNLMPSPNREPVKAKPLQRELFVYELTNSQQATLQDGFYRAVVTTLIKSVKSDAEGKFCLALPEGKYSLFVKEDNKGLYANQFDGDGNIFPVKVEKGNLSIIVFTVDYQANY